MKPVNSAFLDYLTSALNGGADIDELSDKFYDTDVNDAVTARNIISQILKPKFDNFSTEFKQKAKDSLGFYLATGRIDFEKVYNGPLLPIETPDDPKLFYIRIWEIFFNNEDYMCYNTEDFFELEDINEPLNI